VCTIEISKKQQKTKREEERKNLIEEARESNGVELHHKLFKRTQSGIPILHILVIKLRQVLFHGVTGVAHHDPPRCYFLLSHFPSSLARLLFLSPCSSSQILLLACGSSKQIPAITAQSNPT
jgi:hypothetical protein